MSAQPHQANGRKGGQTRAERYHQRMETVIHLEDLGQDFLRLIVRRSVVVAAEPFQGWLWQGAKIVSKPQVGRRLKLVQGHLSATLQYPVTKIERREVSDRPTVQR
jgi:hypothetical protein